MYFCQQSSCNLFPMTYLGPFVLLLLLYIELNASELKNGTEGNSNANTTVLEVVAVYSVTLNNWIGFRNFRKQMSRVC